MVKRANFASCGARVLLLLLLIRSSYSFSWISFSQRSRMGSRMTHISISSSALSATSNKEIYGIPDSGWSSPSWNWGSARGTGHDCAAICREKYSSPEDRKELLHNLLQSGSENNSEVNVEELKLILGLAFQRGRWDGSDGGRGGYGQVLELMASAKRYEAADESISHRLLLEDMAQRYPLLLNWSNPQEGTRKQLQQSMDESVQNDNSTVGLLQCSGLVLQAMDFVNRGL